MFRHLIIGLVVLAVLLLLAVNQRHRIILALVTTGEPVPQVKDAKPVPGGKVYGEDDHFSVIQLDPMTYAIAEPYSWARNVNYLILGEDRALLFDAGVGHYDIRPVVAALTDLPVTFMPSHFHFDHTGQGEWPNIAVVDLPHLRERANGNELTLTWEEHLGTGENIPLPTWTATEWVAPNDSIERGGRSLVLIYTPGHTNNSVSLLDSERALMFTGDFLTSSGALSSFLPTARLGDYLQSAGKVLAKTEQMQTIVMRGAHASLTNETPQASRADVQSLQDLLLKMRAGEAQGEGAYPVVYRIHESMVLSAEPTFLQNWTPTYPDEHPVH